MRGSMRKRVVIAGSSGLIGSALVPVLEACDMEVRRLVHTSSETGHFHWNPERGELDPSVLEGCEAIINLAGENIMSGRWTAARKGRLLSSRVQSTELLANTTARLNRPPSVFLNASATGFYGNRGDEELTEESTSGTGFLAEICRDWEAATVPAENAGVRVVKLRFGAVLTPKGGALKAMLTPFKWGLGGVVGSGIQWMSWIALEDVTNIICTLMQRQEMQGAVNVVTPHPVTNREFTYALGKALHRPTILPLPAFAARLFLGEAADELLLSSTRALPAVLSQHGYAFRFPSLEQFLQTVLQR